MCELRWTQARRQMSHGCVLGRSLEASLHCSRRFLLDAVPPERRRGARRSACSNFRSGATATRPSLSSPCRRRNAFTSLAYRRHSRARAASSAAVACRGFFFRAPSAHLNAAPRGPPAEVPAFAAAADAAAADAARLCSFSGTRLGVASISSVARRSTGGDGGGGGMRSQARVCLTSYFTSHSGSRFSRSRAKSVARWRESDDRAVSFPGRRPFPARAFRSSRGESQNCGTRRARGGRDTSCRRIRSVRSMMSSRDAMPRRGDRANASSDSRRTTKSRFRVLDRQPKSFPVCLTSALFERTETDRRARRRPHDGRRVVQPALHALRGGLARTRRALRGRALRPAPERDAQVRGARRVRRRRGGAAHRDAVGPRSRQGRAVQRRGHTRVRGRDGQVRRTGWCARTGRTT